MKGFTMAVVGYRICKKIGKSGRWYMMPGTYTSRDHAERDALLYRELGWTVTIDEVKTFGI